MRAGAQVLLMATDPLNRRILREMLERPISVGDGRQYQVTPGGQEALFVGSVAERWLQGSPRGPLPIDSKEGGAAVAALVEGWTTTLVHMLAREPHTLDELQGAIEGIDRRALKRQLQGMLDTGLVEALLEGSEGALYAATDWLREGIAPLIAAARLERRRPQEDMLPIDALDTEAGFRLSLPLLELPRELSGSCSLGLNLRDDETAVLTGVTAQIEEGRIISCRQGVNTKADTWAAASAAAWLDTVIESDAKRVRTGGDRWLASALLTALHKTLFGVPVS